MGFASAWLESRSLFTELIKETPDKNTGIIVVVPAFDEPEINTLLDSLISCDKPNCVTEVLIIINAPPGADRHTLENNIKSIKNINSWKKSHNPFFRLYIVDLGQSPVRQWGVGLARKAGLDEALRRYDYLDSPEGVIVNLDADCRVKEDYFLSLENDFLLKRERKACSICFEHPLKGSEFPKEIYRSVAQYELHLRYYYQALKYSGFPWVFHTVGSTIGVRASAYLKAGGMNRRRAGEDFYFIQKLVPAGGYFSLNSTMVYPSPRISSRVPFGTGLAISRMTSLNEQHFMTYNPLAFKDLRDFFSTIDDAFRNDDQELNDLFDHLPESVKSFLDREEWLSRIGEIKKNTSGLQSFTKRFYFWFNMFKVVKYLNYVHKTIYKKLGTDFASIELLRFRDMTDIPSGTIELLKLYRQLEKIC